MYTDTLSDTVSRITVAYRERRSFIRVPYSKEIVLILSIFFRTGYVSWFRITTQKYEDLLEIMVGLRYVKNRPFLVELRQISTKGHRVIWAITRLKWIYGIILLGAFMYYRHPEV